MTKQEETLEEDCCRLVDGVCEMGYQSCALTMFHPNCRDRKTLQPDKSLSKQQELKKGLKEEFRYLLELELLKSLPPQAQELWPEEFVSRVFTYFHTRGVVIKVDRELPREYNSSSEELRKAGVYQRHMLEAGYVAVEPLMEG